MDGEGGADDIWQWWFASCGVDDVLDSASTGGAGSDTFGVVNATQTLINSAAQSGTPPSCTLTCDDEVPPQPD